MIANLYTRTFNNESTIESFIDFYRERVPNIIINIFDMDSKDKTVALAKEKKCNVKRSLDFYNEKDIWRNNCWKNIPTDCVIICSINEYIDITPNIFQNCSIVRTKGYDIVNIKELSLDNRNTNFDKYSIFDPHVIKDMHYEGNGCNPQGFIRVGEINPILYHLTKLKPCENQIEKESQK